MDVGPLQSDPKPRLFHLTFYYSFLLLMKRVESVESVEVVEVGLIGSLFPNGLQIKPSTILHSPLTLYPSFRALLDPIDQFRSVPFHWAIAARPSFSGFGQRREGPTVADAGTVLCASRADAFFV
jgi:hypothetical protein